MRDLIVLTRIPSQKGRNAYSSFIVVYIFNIEFVVLIESSAFNQFGRRNRELLARVLHSALVPK